MRYQKIQKHKAQVVKIQLETLARKTSRSHEIYRKTNKKPQLDKKKKSLIKIIQCIKFY
ncbi:hypothetical protein SKUN_00241 [Spiroplasma kunkelii CR2-3x]|uniref:Uncharacterized protein n=1 Tax=Spiroplasma kunkelii CR2-3x TaxID=273035 RepID=A0A0K2JFZ0_SPIKU|nr:hypothetical protein SKUN_00241 [Spiroplasma kunkelii CR2-3x]